MNTSKPKHRLHFLQQRTNQRGFSLPTATGFGLIILIVGQTLVLRSFNDRVATLGQVASNEAVAAAEIGLTRYQAFLNRNRELAFLNACVPADATRECDSNTWRNAETALATKVCLSSPPAIRTQRLQALAAQDTPVWQDIDPNDSTQGQFKLVSYRVVDQKGYLTVEGRVRQTGAGNTATRDGDTATAKLQVVIPLTPSQSGQPSLYPGVWLQTLETSSNTYINPSTSSPSPTNPPVVALNVRANVFINDCSVDLRAVQANPSSGGTYAVLQTDMPMPGLPPLPTVNDSPEGNSFHANFDGVTSNEPTTPPSPQAYALGTINTNLTLPRAGDVGDVTEGANPTQIFRYLVDNIDLPSRTRLTVNTAPQWVDNQGQTLPVRVELYVQGDLVTGSRIRHDCTGCEPTNFRIYAYQYATLPPENGEYPSFCLTGSRTLRATIFAPGYQIGTTGSAKLAGTLWARTWDTDCGAYSDPVLSQSGSWGNQKVTLPPQLGAVQQWQRQQVSQEVSP